MPDKPRVNEPFLTAVLKNPHHYRRSIVAYARDLQEARNELKNALEIIGGKTACDVGGFRHELQVKYGWDHD